MRVLTIAAILCLFTSGTALLAQAKPVARATVAGQLDAGFAGADTNHDGSLNVAEISALRDKELQQVMARLRAQQQAQFKQLDTNKDGQLSLQEFTATISNVRVNQTAAQILQGYDSNHDGKVSAAEFRAPRLAQFDKIDANHDGIVTPAEEAAASKR